MKGGCQSVFNPQDPPHFARDFQCELARSHAGWHSHGDLNWRNEDDLRPARITRINYRQGRGEE